MRNVKVRKNEEGYELKIKTLIYSELLMSNVSFLVTNQICRVIMLERCGFVNLLKIKYLPLQTARNGKFSDKKSGRRDGVRFGGDAVVCYFNKDAGSRFLPSISLK